MSAMPSGGGYQVQAGGLDSEAGKLDAAGDDVAGIRKAVTSTQCYTPDALGGDDMGPAFNAYAAAWEAEAETLADALHELAGRVRTSSRAYGGAEADNAAGLRAASAGAAVVAPVGGPVVAPVAPGERPFPADVRTQPAPAGPGPTPSPFG